MSSRGVIERLLPEGWQLVRSKGSHRQYKYLDRSGRVTVSHPKKNLPKGTLKSIYKQAGWTL